MRCRSSAAAAVSKRSRTMPSEMRLSPLVGLLQASNFKGSKPNQTLKPKKNLMSGLKCGGEIAKTPILNKK